MSTAAASGVPWGALFAVGGTVAGGLIGFFASVKVNRDATKAATERMHMEHAEADRARFHHLRVELYAKLFSAAQALRVGVADARPHLHPGRPGVLPRR